MSPAMKTVSILVYHGKYGDQYWLANTREQREAAMQALFKQLDEWSCYEGGVDAGLLADARSGNRQVIEAILESRSGYEYEGWDIEEAIDASGD